MTREKLMPGEPVAGITSLLVRPDTVPTQDIRTAEAHPKPAMRARTPNGIAKPVNAVGIVRTAGRDCAGLGVGVRTAASDGQTESSSRFYSNMEMTVLGFIVSDVPTPRVAHPEGTVISV